MLPVKTIEVVSYNDMADLINTKHNIDIRDFKKSSTQFYEWCDAKGYGDLDPEGKNRGSSQIWYAEFNDEWVQGIVVKRPYCDFWHWMIEHVVPDVYNGYIHNGLNWSDILHDYLLDEYGEGVGPDEDDWVAEILKLFVDEFGDKDYNLDFSW